MTSPPRAWAMRASTVASGTLPSPMRVNSRYARFIHFAFQGLETPVAYVLQQQEPQRDLGRCLRASSRRTLFMTLALSCPNQIDEFIVLQQLVGFHHPRLPQCTDIFIHYAFPQGPLDSLPSRHVLIVKACQNKFNTECFGTNRDPLLLSGADRNAHFCNRK